MITWSQVPKKKVHAENFARGQQVALASYDAELVIYSAGLCDRKI